MAAEYLRSFRHGSGTSRHGSGNVKPNERFVRMVWRSFLFAFRLTFEKLEGLNSRIKTIIGWHGSKEPAYSTCSILSPHQRWDPLTETQYRAFPRVSWMKNTRGWIHPDKLRTLESFPPPSSYRQSGIAYYLIGVTQCSFRPQILEMYDCNHIVK